MKKDVRPVYAVIRYEPLSRSEDPSIKWTVVCVYDSAEDAETKSKELMELNAAKGAVYFIQKTRMR